MTIGNRCFAISNPVIFNGIEDLSADKIIIYLNPLSQGNWNLIVGSNLIGSGIEIFEDNGRLVYRTEIKVTHSEIKLDLARGVYFLKLSASNTGQVFKLVRL